MEKRPDPTRKRMQVETMRNEWRAKADPPR